jgi:hypothetical protein
VHDEKPPQKVSADMCHLSAFGCGYSVCKGRYFAEGEVIILVTGLLTVSEFGLGREILQWYGDCEPEGGCFS